VDVCFQISGKHASASKARPVSFANDAEGINALGPISAGRMRLILVAMEKPPVVYEQTGFCTTCPGKGWR